MDTETKAPEVPQAVTQVTDGQPTADANKAADAKVAPVTETVPATETPKEQTPSWLTELDKVDAKDLRKHPKIAGLIGSEAQRIFQTKSQHDRDEQERQARDEKEKAFLDLVEGNTAYIKEHHPLVYQRYEEVQKERASNEVNGLKGKTRHELAIAIGRALQDVPEWKELTEADHESLAKELIGKDEDSVLPVFNRTVIDIISRRRAARMTAEWKEKELAKERDAIRKELSAKTLQNSDAPDMTRPKAKSANSHIDINSLSQDEFDKMWDSLKKPKN